MKAVIQGSWCVITSNSNSTGNSNSDNTILIVVLLIFIVITIVIVVLIERKEGLIRFSSRPHVRWEVPVRGT